MTGAAYVIRGGLPGRERLRVLSSVLAASTGELLARVGVGAGARCADLGCGGGDVTMVLARLAVDGSATGIDIDEAKIGLARKEATSVGLGNVDYRVGDVTSLSEEAGSYDIVYARFLLSHLGEPEVVVRQMVELCKPGGTVVVEDTDISGSLCWPTNEAFERCRALYSATVGLSGGDSDIGRKLPAMMQDCGLTGVEANIVQPGGLRGDTKRIQLLTISNIADSAIALGLAGVDEIERLIDELAAFVDRDDSFVTTARIVQTWGFK